MLVLSRLTESPFEGLAHCSTFHARGDGAGWMSMGLPESGRRQPHSTTHRTGGSAAKLDPIRERVRPFVAT